MILVTKQRLLFFLVSLVLMQMVFLFYMDHLMTHESDIKFLREQQLYIHIVTLVVFIGMIYWLYATSRRIDRELKRIVTLAGTSKYNPDRSKRTLGSLGSYLNDILAQVLLLSDKRRMKISAQNVLIEALQEMIPSFFVVVDIEGLVVGYSVSARERLGVGLTKSAFLGDLITQFEVQQYLAHFSVNGVSISAGEYECYPIYDENVVIHYVLVLDKNMEQSERVMRSLHQGAEKVIRKQNFLHKIEI
ncbi:hypothetical protein PVA44_02825 [Entomospira nematocerorum]|uniref:PAS domain-containing protein n=1 Tax=Entomospira nematocerorum TaxID=2719987 RepID=A0A968GH40_9SPIO|nr:hypothetical protein [Entomospira nematocera]NIZ47031.1 hypothetical protein [Entomospira nematocera]WDI34424.1 hypothetical protein PVA44_02825 [Entomospira nematocera]